MAQNTKQLIERRIEAAISPKLLEVIDESAQHAGHAGAKPGGETHFRVRVVSADFTGLNRVQRHQRIYTALSDLMNNPIHALALELKAPGE